MNREEVINLISSLTGNVIIIAVPKLLVELTSDWDVAVLLSQLLLLKSNRTDNYIPISVKDWKVEMGAVTRHSVEKLQKLPFVKTKVIKADGTPTTHYLIDADLLAKAIKETIQRSNLS